MIQKGSRVRIKYIENMGRAADRKFYVDRVGTVVFIYKIPPEIAVRWDGRSKQRIREHDIDVLEEVSE